MKVPLRYQSTRYDCGTASLLNAIGYLYDREKIPVEFLKTIYNYTLDDFGPNKLPGSEGTSFEALNLVAHHLNNYAEKTGFKIKAELFSGNDIDERLFKKYLRPNTVAVVRVWIEPGHYIMVRDICDDKVYAFDPYYVTDDEYDDDSAVEIVPNEPFKYNRIINRSRFFSHGDGYFPQGKFENREALFISKG